MSDGFGCSAEPDLPRRRKIIAMTIASKINATAPPMRPPIRAQSRPFSWFVGDAKNVVLSNAFVSFEFVDCKSDVEIVVSSEPNDNCGVVGDVGDGRNVDVVLVVVVVVNAVVIVLVVDGDGCNVTGGTGVTGGAGVTGQDRGLQLHFEFADDEEHCWRNIAIVSH
jgi:hypothetical protein